MVSHAAGEFHMWLGTHKSHDSRSGHITTIDDRPPPTHGLFVLLFNDSRYRSWTAHESYVE